MDYSLPGSSIHGILQAKILQWLAIPFSRGSSRCRDGTQVSCVAGRFFIIWVTREAQPLKQPGITLAHSRYLKNGNYSECYSHLITSLKIYLKDYWEFLLQQTKTNMNAESKYLATHVIHLYTNSMTNCWVCWAQSKHRAWDRRREDSQKKQKGKPVVSSLKECLT